MSTEENFLSHIDTSVDTTASAQRLKDRKQNRAWLNHSFKIAIKILERLKELKWSQRQLAALMGVTPQYINHIVKGKENLTLSTLLKLEEVLNISLLVDTHTSTTASVKTSKVVVMMPIITRAGAQYSKGIETAIVKINYANAQKHLNKVSC